MFYGRAFTLADQQGTIVLPCSLCGQPVFPMTRHDCPRLGDHLETMIRREDNAVPGCD